MGVMEVPESVLRQAFDLIAGQWPAEIRPGMKTFHINGGCNMRDLNAAHELVEEWLRANDFDGILDDVIGSVEHYIFATIHDALKNLTVLRTEDLDYEAFVSRFSSHPNYRLVKVQ